MESKASCGGKGGKGGAAGGNGNYYNGEKRPLNGANGIPGKDGKEGNVSRVFKFVNGVNPLAGMFETTTCGEELKANEEATGVTRNLNFADPVQAQAFLNHFGGREYLSEHYPRFYNAFLKTVEAAGEGQLNTTLPDGTIASSFAVTAINSEKPLNSSPFAADADNGSILDGSYLT